MPGDNVQLDTSTLRTDEALSVGNQYTTDLESIRNTLDQENNSGTTLGTMVQSQLKLTESESRYQVRSAIPNKVSKAVKAAAGDVKSAAG